MKQKAKKVLTLTLILLFAILIISIQLGAGVKTVNVPGDYPTITEAIEHAVDGDTILVKDGIYMENIKVNKSIHLIGQDSVLIGEGEWARGAHPVVTLAADGASISGFKIQSNNYTQSDQHASGIYIQTDNCRIENNTIQDCYIGIFSSAQAHATIQDNIVKDCLKDGMRFYGGSSYTIIGNLILDNAVSGIALQGYYDQVINNTFFGNLRAIGLGCSYSVVYQNSMLQNAESGIFLAGSNNVVAANQIQDNKWGVFITPQLAAPRDNKFFHNNFVGNSYGVFVNESSPTEFWDGGSALGGNYWSDYTQKYPAAIETLGIYNTPYQVYTGSHDNYPLTGVFNIAAEFNPPENQEPPKIADGLVAYWTFNSIDATGVSPDSTGKNPAILGSVGSTRSYIPQTVPGKVGNALAFDGQQYVNVPESPSMQIEGEVTVDAWVSVKEFKDIPYNNIIVEARRTMDALPTRTFGVAINGEEPTNSSAPEVGAIRAYVLTDEGLNEIVTSHSVVKFDQWMHVVFTRSLQTGMHLYVDGQEQEVKVTVGTQNPKGAALRQTETYVGHDAVCTIDELKLSNVAASEVQPLLMQWGLWASIIAGIVTAGLMLFALNRNKRNRKHPVVGNV